MVPKKDPPRLSYKGLLVLKAFLDAYDQKELVGADIMRAAGISSGTMYPLLIRFEKSGFLESRWEDGDPTKLGRPRRRLYRLTAAGDVFTRARLRELSPERLTSQPALS